MYLTTGETDWVPVGSGDQYALDDVDRVLYRVPTVMDLLLVK